MFNVKNAKLVFDFLNEDPEFYGDNAFVIREIKISITDCDNYIEFHRDELTQENITFLVKNGFKLSDDDEAIIVKWD